MLSFLCPRRRQSSSSRLQEQQVPLSQQLLRDPVSVWRRSQKTLDDLQTLLHSNPPLETLSQQILTFQKQIYDRMFFQNVLKTYLNHVKSIPYQSDLSKQQLTRITKEAALCCLVSSNFTYAEIRKYSSSHPTELLRIISHKVADYSEKRSMILQLYSYCSNHIQQLLSEYILYSLDLSPQFFAPFIVTLQQYQTSGINMQDQEDNNDSETQYKNSNQAVYNTLVKLCRDLNNYNISNQICQYMVQHGAYLPRVDLPQFLFALRVGEYLIYRQGRMDIQFSVINSTSPQDFVAQLLKTSPIRVLDSVTAIFQTLGQNTFTNAVEQFALSEETELATFLELVRSNYVSITNQNLRKVVKKIQNGHFEYSKLESTIRPLLKPFQQDEEVEIVLTAIEYSKIFYIYDINSQVSELVSMIRLLRNLHNELDIKTLQEHALMLFREFIAKVALCRNKEQKIAVAGIFYNLQSAETVLKLSKFMKDNVFGRLLSTPLMHQIIFQHLIAFQRLSFVEELLQNRYIERYELNYPMIEMIIIEQIHQKFLNAQSFHSIQHSLQYLIVLVTTKTLERKILMATYKLALYLHNQNCHIPPSRLVNSLDISLLYSLANLQPQLDFNRVYKYILKTGLTDVSQKVDTDTKEFSKFKGELALKLFRKGFQQQALQTLSSLLPQRPSWFCSIVLSILQDPLEKSPQLEQQLTAMAFETLQNGGQLRALKACREKTAKRQVSFYKRFIDPNTNYFVMDDIVIRNQEVYNNLIAECKFTDNTLKVPEYDLFFMLLPSDVERAFKHIVVRKLDIAKIDFFLKECAKYQILDYPQILAPLYEASLKLFDHKQKRHSNIKDRIVNNPQLNEMHKNIFLKLDQAMSILQVCPKGFLQKWIPFKDRIKFLEDKPYRRKELVELLSVVSPADCSVLAKIAEHEMINLRELAFFSICNLLNTGAIYKSSSTLVQNFCALWASSLEGAEEVLQKLLGSIYSLQVCLAFVSYLLLDSNNNTYLRRVVRPYNLAILESLARIQVDTQFYNMVPRDFLSRKLSYDPKSELTANHRMSLTRVLRLENVFVLSKAMYFFYNLNSRVEREVLQMLANRSPLIQARIAELKNSPA